MAPFFRGQFADLGLAALVVGAVTMMIVPLPTLLLDFLFACNLAVGVLMVLIAMYIPNGLSFASMPTVLLVATLFRLALTISATRLILLHAHAGRMIASFGEFVVQGNYAVGAVVFIILTIVQYLVIARGAERVAEVGARFSLDAVPGRQMAIDADLRAGALTPDQAQQSRRALQRESQFYGAMDGAMKFVKGDAIAGIVITAIVLVAGVGIGIGMRGMSVVESLRLFGLLTIGNGLVMQICSLLVSTSAAVMVTRVASESEQSSLGTEIGTQLFSNPRLIGVGAIFMAVLAIVPGLPALPFLLVAALSGTLAWRLTRTRSRAPRGGDVSAGTSDPTGHLSAPTPVTVELGAALAREFLAARAGARDLTRELETTRDRLLFDLGIELPAPRVYLSEQLDPNLYRLSLEEIPAGQGFIPAGKVLALASRELVSSMGGQVEMTFDPATGKREYWIGREQSAALQRVGIGVLSGATLIARHLENAVRRRPQDWVNLQQVQNALDAVGRSHPALVKAVIPSVITLPLLTEVLRRLVEDGVSIRPLREILEAFATGTPSKSDPVALAEQVRMRLARQITYRYARAGTLAAHQLDPEIEDAVREAVHIGADGVYLALRPDLARDIIGAISRVCSEPDAGDPPLILTQSDLRPHLKRLLAHDLSRVVVLSYTDLTPEVSLKPLKAVNLSA